ncbi:Cmx/CmrA family chloramphenicol efflux MFS transporter [Actinomycetota bacterium Odt1-20B]
MPFALYMLGLAVFAQGTSEFMLSGLIPDIAADLDVSVAAAGSLTSAFAVGMVVGAPLMAALSLSWPRRRALLAFLITFLCVHVLGALTTSYAVLVGTRVVGALANAGFLAVALAAATSMVAPDAKGRATSVLLGGVTLACVAGVPAGALLGTVWGWRSAFWAVAVVSVPAVVAIVRSVPDGDSVPGSGFGTSSGAGSGGAGRGAAAAALRAELGVLRRPRLLVTLLLGALVNGATFCTFTYLATLATDVSEFGDAWVPGVLALFGAGSFLGVTAAGRLADTRPVAVLTVGGTALLTGWVLFALTAGNPVAAAVLVLVQGTLSFAVGTTLITRALYAGSDAPTLAGGFATAALNVGAALGPTLGGLTLDTSLGHRAPLWVSALLVGLAVVVGGAAEAVGRRSAAKGPAGAGGIAEQGVTRVS